MRTASQRSQHGSQQSPQKFESSKWHGVGSHPWSEIGVSPYVGTLAPRLAPNGGDGRELEANDARFAKK
jgi:hypothetical protein